MNNIPNKYLLNIVIVNWNTKNYLRDCVDSIFKYELRDDICITIVDNNSTDKSLHILKKNEKRIKIIRLDKNYGFAKACNIGANHVESKYLLFLNPDTKLLNNCITKSLNFFIKKDKSDLGILGIKNVDINNQTLKTCSYFPNLLRIISSIFGIEGIYPIYTSNFMRNFSHDENKIVDQVIGAFFMIKKELFSRLKGFDESFFMYYEEVDLSYRAKAIGLKSFFLSQERIFHIGGGSSSQVKALRLFYTLRSKVIYINKHFSKQKKFIVFFAIIIFEPITRILKLLITLNFKSVLKVINAFAMFYVWCLKKIFTRLRIL